MTHDVSLRCPRCGCPELAQAPGSLTCSSCHAEYGRTDDVIDFTGGTCSADKEKCAANWAVQFGKEFRVTTDDLLEDHGFWGKNAFFSYCGLAPEDVQGKTVLIACGGTGREAWHCLNAGAAMVYVLDLGEHLFALTQLLEGFQGRFVLVRADATVLPFSDGSFDLCLCDHALQHIPDHKTAFSELKRCCKPYGLVSVCVYSHENNFLMTRIVEPSKVVLHLLPLRAIRLLSFFPAILLYLVHCAQRFMVAVFSSVNPERILFYRLFDCWFRHGFPKFWEACFDLMHAPVSYHFRKGEMVRLASDNRLDIVALELKNQSMWTMVCRFPKGT